MNSEKLNEALRYAQQAEGSGLIIRNGQVVASWGDMHQRYDLKSTTKSIGVTALGIALDDQVIELDAPAIDYHSGFGIPPRSNADTGWVDRVTIRHLATQTAGFEKRGGYEPLLFEPGSKWHYSDGGPNWLAECLTLIYDQDVQELMFERVFEPIGIDRENLRWRNNQYRPHEINGVPRREFGSGVHASVDAMARIGLLYSRQGRWRDEQILSSSFVQMATAPIDNHDSLPEFASDQGNASVHYGMLWWNNADGAIENIPTNTFWSWGLYDSLIIVFPDWDIVVARAGRSWHRDDSWGHYEVLAPFLQPIAGSVIESTHDRLSDAQPSPSDQDAPYPPSQIIQGINWASPETVIRRARGGDNWPLTWADDDYLYSAYGDGFGFEPRVESKLSMGLVRISGGPNDFEGENLRSHSFEASGDGRSGRKTSGMLMVDGVLLALVRNADNSQLGRSLDRGQSWEWADWRFEESFGYPTFVNFGRNYEGARDDFLYIVSSDSDSAYEAADRMVLARVNKDAIFDRDTFQFFAGIDSSQQVHWSDDIADRQSVFTHPNQCYRSGITYHPQLQRYLWCQVLPPEEGSPGPRFEGGFGIYDASEPWGPWTTVFFTKSWDMGPGETCSIPTKWISDDGKTIHLVFSGEDCFSVRRGELVFSARNR